MPLKTTKTSTTSSRPVSRLMAHLREVCTGLYRGPLVRGIEALHMKSGMLATGSITIDFWKLENLLGWCWPTCCRNMGLCARHDEEYPCYRAPLKCGHARVEGNPRGHLRRGPDLTDISSMKACFTISSLKTSKRSSLARRIFKKYVFSVVSKERIMLCLNEQLEASHEEFLKKCAVAFKPHAFLKRLQSSRVSSQYSLLCCACFSS